MKPELRERLSILAAEVVGTFALVFAGCGAIVVQAQTGALGHLGVCMVFGLVVLAMIYSVGNISGAHLNPAVTVGFWAAGRMGFGKVPGYVLAQLAGALLAGLLLRLIFPETATLGETMPAGALWQSFALETVLTFLLMFVILNVSTGAMEKGIMAGVAVGGSVTLLALFGGPVSGASMNPARSLGPALVNGTFTHQWLYIAAPVIGALLASPWCRIIQGRHCSHVNGESACESGVEE